MKKTAFLLPSSQGALWTIFLFVFTVFMDSCENKNFETCSGQPVCPPFEKNLSPEIQKLREEIAGKWKFVRVETRDTFHKTGTTYNTQRYGLCISYEGGILYHQNYKEVNCTYCYDLKKDNGTMRLALDEGATNTYCAQALQSSDVIIGGDSMVLFRRDSFVTKRTVFKRANDDWTFKTN
jgi:hypothetical protein